MTALLPSKEPHQSNKNLIFPIVASCGIIKVIELDFQNILFELMDLLISFQTYKNANKFALRTNVTIVSTRNKVDHELTVVKNILFKISKYSMPSKIYKIKICGYHLFNAVYHFLRLKTLVMDIDNDFEKFEQEGSDFQGS